MIAFTVLTCSVLQMCLMLAMLDHFSKVLTILENNRADESAFMIFKTHHVMLLFI